MACLTGRCIVALYDMRPDSRTSGWINEIELGEHDRYVYLFVPPWVAHAFINPGSEPALLIDFAANQSGPNGDFYLNPPHSIPYPWPQAEG